MAPVRSAPFLLCALGEAASARPSPAAPLPFRLPRSLARSLLLPPPRQQAWATLGPTLLGKQCAVSACTGARHIAAPKRPAAGGPMRPARIVAGVWLRALRERTTPRRGLPGQGRTLPLGCDPSTHRHHHHRVYTHDPLIRPSCAVPAFFCPRPLQVHLHGKRYAPPCRGFRTGTSCGRVTAQRRATPPLLRRAVFARGLCRVLWVYWGRVPRVSPWGPEHTHGSARVLQVRQPGRDGNGNGAAGVGVSCAPPRR